MDGNICASFTSLSFSNTKAITIAIFTECTFYEKPFFIHHQSCNERGQRRRRGVDDYFKYFGWLMNYPQTLISLIVMAKFFIGKKVGWNSQGISLSWKTINVWNCNEIWLSTSMDEHPIHIFSIFVSSLKFNRREIKKGAKQRWKNRMWKMMTITLMMMLLRWLQSIIFVKGKIRCRLLTVCMYVLVIMVLVVAAMVVNLGNKSFVFQFDRYFETHPKNLLMFDRDRGKIFKPVCWTKYIYWFLYIVCHQHVA